MNLGLEGKRAIVTGGSKGMGRAIALALAAEGCRVAIAARGQDALKATVSDIESAGGEAIAVRADVAREDDIRTLVEMSVQGLQGLDILIVNAGGPPAKTFEELTEDDWRSAIDLTLMSAVNLIRQAVPHLEKSGGSVVTISSYSVKQPIPGLLLSNTIRPAVAGLVKTLADELGPKGVRLNSVLPGMIMTERSRDLAKKRAEASSRTVDEVTREAERGIPLGRYGTPGEVASLVVFLASGASSYITGCSILCDGGQYRGLM